MKFKLAIGTLLLGCGVLGLFSVGVGASSNRLMRNLSAAPSGLPVSSAAGTAMFVSGAIVIFLGRNRIS